MSVILSRQRGFLMLGLAAVVVTAAAVFIMLKLVSSDESNYSKRRRGRFDRHNHRNSPFTNSDFPTNSHEIRPQETSSGGQSLSALPYSFDLPKGHSIESSDRPFPLNMESGEPESQDAAVEGDRINSDTLPLETHSNGYSDTGFNIPETTNQTDSLAKKKGIALPETDGRPKVDIIEALIEDLQQLNPAKRGKAIWELGQRGDSRAVEPLLDLLANSDSKQYSLILASLSEIGIRTLKPMNNAWSISLQNENPEVRKNAIRDLTRIYELVNQISYLLHRATDDPDPEVQETARWAINQLNRLRPRSGMD
ncbi:MAG TPA: HEAT repeat domain-containing protein [Microcoleus sp.]|nr:HEAT repeat domain-containing protein [Microcoleus sp.]